ncbi:MAG TPA: anti-sigma factor [Solirubrobacteraceae bacterium]|nr:anti-sigma factor [Solirubrobacteraceae bacterium]
MSSREPHADCPVSVDAAPYVLGALEDAELQRYREHLSACTSCRAEVAELQSVADELPASAPPVLASAALRERILATVRAEAALLSAAGDEADRPPRQVSRWRTRRFSLLGAGAGLAGAVAVLVAILIGVGSGTSESTKVTRGIVEANAPGARASLRQSDGRAELVVSRMPQPALGKIYEVWLSRGKGDAQPTDALFSVTSGGSGSVAVPHSLRGVKEVMVTSEPLGGSLHPTSQPVIRVALSA